MQRLKWNKEREKNGQRRLFYRDMHLSPTGHVYYEGAPEKATWRRRFPATLPKRTPEPAVRVVRVPSEVTLTAQLLRQSVITKRRQGCQGGFRYR